jgi:hypothetical protein
MGPPFFHGVMRAMTGVFCRSRLALAPPRHRLRQIAIGALRGGHRSKRGAVGIADRHDNSHPVMSAAGLARDNDGR